MFDSHNVFSLLQELCSQCNNISCQCIDNNSRDVSLICVEYQANGAFSSNPNTFSDEGSLINNFSTVTDVRGSYREVYELDTFVESDINSVDNVYDSSVHVINVSPLLAQNDLKNLGLRGRGLRIGHLNVQGIRSGEKVDQLKFMLHSKQNNICMLGISESKLGSDIPDSFCQIADFKCYRKDKVQGSGGLLVYVRYDISCIRRVDLEDENFESMWFEISQKNSKSFLVGHIYRNPASTVAWNETFDNQIDKVMEDEKELFILGDVNRDLLNMQIKTPWLEYMNTHGLIQHVNEPTRVVPNSSETLIDHIYSNFSENIQHVDVPNIGLSDHYPVFFTRKMNFVPPKRTHHTIKYRSFKNFNETKFIEDLKSVPWDIIKIFDNVDDALEAWYSLFKDAVDKHAPLKQHRVKNINQPDWLTPEIIDSIKIRDRYKSLGNDDQYKIWRNKVIRLIRQSKKAHYQTLIEEGKNQPCTIWKIFSQLGAGKQKSDDSKNVNSIKIGNMKMDNPIDVANAFNNYFVTIAENIKEPIVPSNHEKLSQFCRSKIPNDVTFELPLLSNDKVLKYLKGLHVNKSTGSDEIGPRLLKMASPFISESLTYICNLSIHTGGFPEKWKEAKVKPLHKGGHSNEPNNFRPISILPVLSKLFEKHVHESLMVFLIKYDLLYNTQSGFRTNHSCETALIHMIDKWLKALDKGEIVGAILVDFRKAFDLVDHNILLNKLKLYKINRTALNWFESYLKYRPQKVSFNNLLSEERYVKHGVPQGSILGPLLFLLFINDLPLHTDVNTDLYADDATIYQANSSLKEIEITLQKALSNIAEWCKQNGMLINLDKTKAMLITTRQKRNRLERDINIIFNGIPLTTVSNERILGVQIDNNLLWGDHISKVAKKMSTNIWLLSKIKCYLSLEHRLLFYKGYIQPHLDYANTVWGGTARSNISKIERLQKRACRVILDYKMDNIYKSMNDLKIMTLSERLFFRKAKLMFKVSNAMTPDYINDIFSRRQQLNLDGTEMHVLRSMAADNFILPKPKTELYKGSMAFSGPIIWGSLPTQVKNAPSVESFHSRCIKWMKS